MTTDAQASPEDEELASSSVSQAKTARRTPAKKDPVPEAIETLQREMQSLATLVHSLRDDAPEGTIRGSKINNMSARLETLERQVQGENGLLSVVKELETGPANEVDTEGVEQLRRSATELQAQLGQLKAAFEGYSAPVAVEQVMSEIKQLREHVDAVGKMRPGLDTVSSSLRDSLTDYIDNALEERAEDLAPLVQRLSGVLGERVDSVVTRQGVMEKTMTSLVQLAEGNLAAGRTGLSTPTTGAVYGKVLALMDEVDHIAKDKTASGGGVHYKFRGIEDAQNAVGAAMRKVRILLRPEVVSWDYGQVLVDGFDSKGKPKQVWWATSRLTMRYTFVAPEDGSEFTVEMVGEGKDNSDKSASKAASMACKYALFQSLMIPFEQVDESDAQNDAIAAADRRPGAPAQPEHPRDFEQRPSAQAPTPAVNTPQEKAAALVQWVYEAQKLPATDALPKLKTAQERAEKHGLNDLEVEGVPVRMHISTGLQIVNTAITQAAGRTGAGQGMTRQDQLAGRAAQAAVDTDPDMTDDMAAATEPPRQGDVTRQQYEAAIEALRGHGEPLDEDGISECERIVNAYEGRAF